MLPITDQSMHMGHLQPPIVLTIDCVTVNHLFAFKVPSSFYDNHPLFLDYLKHPNKKSQRRRQIYVRREMGKYTERNFFFIMTCKSITALRVIPTRLKP